MLRKIMKQHPEMREIRREEDVIMLLSCLRTDIGSVDPKYLKFSLANVLGIVEKGTVECYNPRELVQTEIDLSEARNMLAGYRNLSEGGCTSCVNVGVFKPYPDETNVYCNLNESEKDVADVTGQSPLVAEHWNNENCRLVKHKFRRIEEVLAE
jgi:hypothetical protein